MSNLIKSVYFNVETEKKYLIDSDSRVENYIPDLRDNSLQSGDASPFQPIQLGVPLEKVSEQTDIEEEQFQDGLSVIHMDDVIEQEREKLSNEIAEQTQKEVEQLLSEAQQEAQQIVTQAMEQAQTIQQEAYEQGFCAGQEEGLKKAEVQLQLEEQKYQEQYQGRVRQLEEQQRQMEPFFADLTANLIQKLTGILCEDKKEVILHLLTNAVQNLEKPKQILIRISKADMAYITSQKNSLRALAGDVEVFDVIEDSSLSHNQCIIETETKMIDCSLDAQLQNLSDHIKMLAR